MTEKCCESMEHYEHMCSMTLNGCAAEAVAGTETASSCSPCDNRAHRHFEICVSSYIGA